MKNSILADALFNATKNSEPESAITKLVASSVGEQQKQNKRKVHAQAMTLPELFRIKNEYSGIINDPLTSNEKRKEISELIKSLNHEIRNRTKDTPAMGLKESRSAIKQDRRGTRENYRKSIQVRSFKKTIPPDQFTISNKDRNFLPRNEKTLERERLRKELIAKEAQIELERMALLSRISHTKTKPAKAPNQIKISIAKNTIKQEISTVIKDESVAFYFNSELYTQLIRTMPVSQAYKIAKNRELSSQYYDSKIRSGEYTYFNTLAYLISLRNKSSDESQQVARNKEQSEFLLYNLVVIGYKIKVRNKNAIVGKIKKGNVVNSVEVSDLKLISSNVQRTLQLRRISDQQGFRRRVERNFNGRCAVTGQSIQSVLQACHLEDYSFSYNMDTSNGILLTSDCHRMFDNGQLGIDPETLTIHFAVECIYAKMFEGKMIGKHSVALDKNKLRKKWELFLNTKKSF
ncbi:HNH endonuclease signature motif containing protein [Pseudescherichia sp.]|uniref:HNH endonuclease signature motif containing protein n=1 Tax=Pseudescherichia sp. TaxID=2055881 RepID=UPI00289776FA|nr:HNH endonuclease signature motif containing protein [Pseudescherichia sp.]